MTDDLFNPPEAVPHSASGPAPEEVSPDASGAFSSGPFEGGDERCPACGLEPCGCGLEVIPIDDSIPIYDRSPFAAVEQEQPGYCGRCSFDPCACALLDGSVMRALDQVAATIAPPAERLGAWRSPAIAAFLDRRDALQAKHGERACTDRSRPPHLIAHDLRERGSALVDRLTGRRHLIGSAKAREDFEIALATAATAGALAIALYERLSAECEKPAFGGDEGGLDADATGGEAASRAITADDSAGSRS